MSSYQQNQQHLTYREEPPVKGFNWGAAGLPQPWTLYHRQWMWFVLALLMPLVASIVLGFLGNRIGWESGQWRDEEEFVRSNERWRLAGIVTIIMVSLVLLVVGILWVLVLAAVMNSALLNNGGVGGLGGPL